MKRNLLVVASLMVFAAVSFTGCKTHAGAGGGAGSENKEKEPYSIIYHNLEEYNCVKGYELLDGVTLVKNYKKADDVELPDEDEIFKQFYFFEGWYDNEDFSGDPITGWKAGEKTGKVELYAKWYTDIENSPAAIEGLDNEKVYKIYVKDLVTDASDLLNAVKSTDSKVHIDMTGMINYTALPDKAFINSLSLYGIELPLSLQTIGSSAFEGCDNLSKLVIPANVNRLGGSMLKGINDIELTLNKQLAEKTYSSSLSLSYYIEAASGLKVRLSEDTEALGYYVLFSTDSMVSLYVPSSVKLLKMDSTSYCDNLVEVTGCEGLEEIGPSAFEKDKKLESISLHEGLLRISDGVFRNCDSLKNIVIPDSVTTIGAQSFSGCKLESLSIQAELINAHANETELTDPDNSSAKISVNLFLYYLKTERLILKEGSTELVEGFARGSQLKEVVFPSTLKTIGKQAFQKCKKLTNFDLPAGLETIGDGAFAAVDGITEISIPDSVTSVGASAFNSCYALTSAYVGKNVPAISDYMFHYCKLLETIDGCENVKSIGVYGIGDCEKLTSIPYLSKLEAISRFAFYNDTFEDIKLAPTVTKIEIYAFSHALIKKIIFEDKEGWYKTSNETYWKNENTTTSTVSVVTAESLGDAEANAANLKDSNKWASYYFFKTK